MKKNNERRSRIATRFINDASRIINILYDIVWCNREKYCATCWSIENNDVSLLFLLPYR